MKAEAPIKIDAPSTLVELPSFPVDLNKRSVALFFIDRSVGRYSKSVVHFVVGKCEMPLKKKKHTFCVLLWRFFFSRSNRRVNACSRMVNT